MPSTTLFVAVLSLIYAHQSVFAGGCQSALLLEFWQQSIAAGGFFATVCCC
jgi:hypothetical protein